MDKSGSRAGLRRMGIDHGSTFNVQVRGGWRTGVGRARG